MSRRPEPAKKAGAAAAAQAGGQADGPADDAELKSLQKLWLVLAAICLLMSINVLAATQGGDVTLSLKTVLGIELDKDIPEAVAGLWGVIYLGVFSIAANAVALVHARRERTDWSVRYPFRAFDIPAASGVGRGVQVVAILVLTLLPMWVLGHSWREMIKYGVFCAEVEKADWRPLPDRGYELFFSTPERVRLTSSEALIVDEDPATPDTCDNKKLTDYWPPVETALLALLGLVAAGGTVWLFGELFLRGRLGGGRGRKKA